MLSPVPFYGVRGNGTNRNANGLMAKSWTDGGMLFDFGKNVQSARLASLGN